MKTKKASYNAVDVLQLQTRLQNAVSDAVLNGMKRAEAVTSNFYAIEDAIAPFSEAGYTTRVKINKGIIGRNLVRLTTATITLSWS